MKAERLLVWLLLVRAENTYIYFAKAATHTRRPLNVSVMPEERILDIRLLKSDDSIEELTDLIHLAYRQLADLGFQYWGAHQTVADTKKRISRGECYIIKKAGQIIGTITLNLPNKTYPHPWYDRPKVTTFHQFAVNPSYQKQGLGTRLMDLIEKRALELGALELACDTAICAIHLIELYKKRGYRKVGEADWNLNNFKNLILSKTLKSLKA